MKKPLLSTVRCLPQSPLKRKLELCVKIAFLVVLLSVLGTSQISFSTADELTQWDRTYGGANGQVARTVVQTSDGGYAISGYSSHGWNETGGDDFWLVKTDPMGNMLWNRTYGGTGDESSYSMVLTADGGYALVGYTSSFGAGGNDFWLVKTDASGNMQWNKTYGGTGSDVSYSMVKTSDGGYALAGSTSSFGAGNEVWLVKTDSNGNVQWSKTYGGTQHETAHFMVQTRDGGYALTGATNSFGAGGNDVFLFKTDSAGNMQWNRTYGGTYDQEGHSMVQTSDEGYAIAGSTAVVPGYSDGFFVRTDAEGNQLWNRTYGGTEQERINVVIQNSDGGYVLAGAGTWLLGDRSYNVWLFKTDSNGNQLWNRTYGGEYFDEAYDVIQTSDGGYALASTSLSFGDQDFWLIKTDEHGVVPEFSTTVVPMALLVTATSVAILLGKIVQAKSGYRMS